MPIFPCPKMQKCLFVTHSRPAATLGALPSPRALGPGVYAHGPWKCPPSRKALTLNTFGRKMLHRKSSSGWMLHSAKFEEPTAPAAAPFIIMYEPPAADIDNEPPRRCHRQERQRANGNEPPAADIVRNANDRPPPLTSPGTPTSRRALSSWRQPATNQRAENDNKQDTLL